jgi:hypothetical protein
MLREKPSITPMAYYTPAREPPTYSSTSRPTTSSQATTFSRLMGCSISLRTPTSRARLKTTRGIWRNTACDLKFCFMANITLTQFNSSWLGSGTTKLAVRRGISLARFIRPQLTASVINPSCLSHLRTLASSASVLSSVASYAHEPLGYIVSTIGLSHAKQDPCKVRQVTSAYLKKSDERTGSAVRKCRNYL